MLAELSLHLHADQEIKMWHSSLFQGAMMECVNQDYAQKLHQSELHPYSIFISTNSNNEGIWKIRTLDDEAYKGIIEPWISPELKAFSLNKKNMKVDIFRKTLTTCDEKELLKDFYEGETERYLKVCFESPTAFKRDGKYVFMPDVSLIFGSLMRKYSSSSKDLDMTDQETLDYIIEHTAIAAFRIRSTVFPLEGVKIPSFIGEVTFRFSGTETMARYARLLLQFGEFSGVGIKSGIGMGAIKIIRGKRDER